MIRRPEGLSPLEIMILTFVRSGFSAPYDLVGASGMSIGLTSPALKRLEQAGFLTQTTGPRNRTDYALTDKGREKLLKSLGNLRKDYWEFARTGRFDSASRAILLLWSHFGPVEALACLNEAAEELRSRSRRKQREAEDLREEMGRLERAPPTLFDEDDDSQKGRLLAVSYRWIKASSDAALLGKQADVMENVATLLPELPESLRQRSNDS